MAAILINISFSAKPVSVFESTNFSPCEIFHRPKQLGQRLIYGTFSEPFWRRSAAKNVCDTNRLKVNREVVLKC